MVTFVVVAGVIAKLLYDRIETRGLAALDTLLDDVRPWLTLLRWTVLVSLIAAWPRWVGWLVDADGLAPTQRQPLAALRWRVAAGLLALETFWAARWLPDVVGRIAGLLTG